ncbi:MAG: hypothetical protein KBS53_00140 [Bacteroidales bacterium]|nr:hypothetical protein [Candidatus Hennigimonas equi]
MATDKLQELTDRLYAEGLAKGRDEGEKILEQARQQAAEIVARANAEAESIVSGARKRAEDMLAKASSDVKMASSQALDAVRESILNAVTAKSVEGGVREALDNTEFAKQVILAAAKAFSAQTPCDLEVVLPESCTKDIVAYVQNEVASAIGKGIEVKLGKKFDGGLTIGPKDGGYFVSLTDATFIGIIKEYLRPATRKTLFGE